jgi:hypothetical protein
MGRMILRIAPRRKHRMKTGVHMCGKVLQCLRINLAIAVAKVFHMVTECICMCSDAGWFVAS